MPDIFFFLNNIKTFYKNETEKLKIIFSSLKRSEQLNWNMMLWCDNNKYK